MSKQKKKVIKIAVQRVNAERPAKSHSNGNSKHREDFDWLLKTAVGGRNK